MKNTETTESPVAILVAARLTGLSRQTIHKAIRQGSIPVVGRDSRRVFINPADVRDYINAPKDKGGRPRKNNVVIS